METSTRQRPRPAHGACDQAACSPTPNCRTRSLQYPNPLLLRSLSLISSCRGPGGPQLDDMSRKHRTAAATAYTWRVRRGRMLADDELQDTQTAVPPAVPRPAAGARLQQLQDSYEPSYSYRTVFEHFEKSKYICRNCAPKAKFEGVLGRFVGYKKFSGAELFEKYRVQKSSYGFFFWPKQTKTSKKTKITRYFWGGTEGKPCRKAFVEKPWGRTL